MVVTTREGTGERQQAEVSVRCHFFSLHVVVFLVLFQGTKRSVQSVLFCALCSTSSLLALEKDNTSPQLDSIVRQLKRHFPRNIDEEGKVVDAEQKSIGPTVF